jgi:hypothetical protein
MMTAWVNAPNPCLESIRAPQLLEHGLTLLPPTESPKVNASDARQSIDSLFPGARILEMVPAVLGSTIAPDLDGKFCWVASIVPKGGIWFPSSGAPGNSDQRSRSAHYEYVLIDATTGEFLQGGMGD